MKSFFLRLGRLGVPASCLLKGELQGSVNDGRKDNRRKQYQISSHVQKVGRFKDLDFWKDITELVGGGFPIQTAYFYRIHVAVYVYNQTNQRLTRKINHPTFMSGLKEAWLSTAVPSTRNVLACDSQYAAVSAFAPALCLPTPQSLMGIKTK